MTFNLKLQNISPIGFETITYHTGQYTSISNSIHSPTLHFALYSPACFHTQAPLMQEVVKKKQQQQQKKHFPFGPLNSSLFKYAAVLQKPVNNSETGGNSSG